LQTTGGFSRRQKWQNAWCGWRWYYKTQIKFSFSFAGELYYLFALLLVAQLNSALDYLAQGFTGLNQ
jgi:hypothetical protein